MATGKQLVGVSLASFTTWGKDIDHQPQPGDTLTPDGDLKSQVPVYTV